MISLFKVITLMEFSNSMSKEMNKSNSYSYFSKA